MAKVDSFEFIKFLKKMLDEKDLVLSFSAHKMGIRLDGDKIKVWLHEKGFDEAETDEEISYKLSIFSKIILNLLNGKEINLIVIKKEFIDEDYNKIRELLKDNFINEPLKQDYALESSAKNSLLKRLEWDILNKNISTDKFALLKFYIENTGIEEEKTFLIEFNLNKIDELIKELEKVKEGLKK